MNIVRETTQEEPIELSQLEPGDAFTVLDGEEYDSVCVVIGTAGKRTRFIRFSEYGVDFGALKPTVEVLNVTITALRYQVD